MTYGLRFFFLPVFHHLIKKYYFLVYVNLFLLFSPTEKMKKPRSSAVSIFSFSFKKCSVARNE